MSNEINENVESLTGDLRIRISPKDLVTFQEKSKNVTGKPYQLLLREIITAFNQGRLRIIPTEEQKNNLGEFYNVN